MSWRARERRIFNRLVQRLKATPVYRLGDFTIIDADIVFMRKGESDLFSVSKSLRQPSLKSNIQNGKIEVDKDFDAIYNPSLTLKISFATSKAQVNQVVCEALDEIAASWKARLIELGMKDKRLFRYYDVDAEEWSLEFLNSDVPVSTIADRCRDVKFFLPEL